MKKTLKEKYRHTVGEETFEYVYKTGLKYWFYTFIWQVVRYIVVGIVLAYALSFLMTLGMRNYIPNVLPELNHSIEEYEITAYEKNGEVKTYHFESKGEIK